MVSAVLLNPTFSMPELILNRFYVNIYNNRSQVAKPVDPAYPLDNKNQRPLTPPNLSARTPNKSAAAALAAEKDAEFYGPKDKADNRAKPFGDFTSDTLFIGNLAFAADENAIVEAFSKYGTVVNARMPSAG